MTSELPWMRIQGLSRGPYDAVVVYCPKLDGSGEYEEFLTGTLLPGRRFDGYGSTSTQESPNS